MKILRFKEFYLPDNHVSNINGARTTAFIAHSVGFHGEPLAIITAIAGGESSFDSEQITTSPTYKGADRGLWQINSYWHGPDSDGPLRYTDEECFNPWTAAKAAWEISRQGTKFGAWNAFTDKSPEYVRQLPYAKDAAAWVESGGVSLIRVKVEGRTALSPTLAKDQIGCSYSLLMHYNPNVTWPAKPGTYITFPRGLRPARLFAGPR